MVKDTKEYVLSCTSCAQAKASHRPPAGLLRPLPIPKHPWSHTSMDFITGLSPSNSYKVIITIVDRFSKMVHLVPLKKLLTSSTMADMLACEVFQLHGLPRILSLTGGPQFVYRLWRSFCTHLGIQVSLSSGFRPQTGRQTERLNQEVETKLCLLCQDNATTWSRNLPWVEHVINSLPSTATRVSPSFAMFSYQPPVFSVQEVIASTPSAHASALWRHRAWWAATWCLLQASTIYARAANRRCNPAPPYRVGQRVWLSTVDVPLRVDCWKMAPCFISPFPIAKVFNPCGCPPPSAPCSADPPVLPCLQDQACTALCPWAHLQAPSPHPACGWTPSLVCGAGPALPSSGQWAPVPCRVGGIWP
uniref:Integrase catalytic domain-containing protein n=1 Tax=Nothobranchius furzeri TaxID=105023 RepID=A0A8C6W0T4_NOTFU